MAGLRFLPLYQWKIFYIIEGVIKASEITVFIFISVAHIGGGEGFRTAALFRRCIYPQPTGLL